MNAIVAPEPNQTSVLIVDDEAGHRDSLSEMIGLSGYTPATAGSADEAIEYLDAEPFDVVLLDLKMPGRSGFDVINHVVENGIRTKVVVVSGEANFDAARKALKQGAYDFVRKPYLPDELLSTMDNAANSKRLEEETRRTSEKLAESEHLYRFLVDHSPDIVFMLDSDGRFTFLNDTVYETLGIDKSNLIGKHYSTIISAESEDQAKHVFTERRMGERKSRNVELKLKSIDESDFRYFDTTSMAVTLNQHVAVDSPFKGTYGVARDVTERKQAQELIRFQAYHDLLTNLPNRALMEDRLSMAISQAKRNQQHLAVMFLDLDRFKWVNDTMGHSMGDRLIQAVSHRIEDCLRKGDTLARFGGDEFALVLPEVRDHNDAATIANKILNVLSDPFVIEDHDLYVTASIGIAMYPEAGKTTEALIRSGDIAMYRVKDSGKNGYEFFRPEMNDTSNARLNTERELRRALVSDELHVCYQPQVNAASESVVGFEALVRWAHPERGTVYPADFIPIAEETGLILDVGQFVFETACRDLRDWRNKGMDNVRVSVNFAAAQVEQEDFVQQVTSMLNRYGLPGSAIEVEITESVIMSDMAQVILKLRKLAALGIKVAIDDFGTGYSSLSYLQQFPISTLKIDKSFVSTIHRSDSGTSIVNAIVAMAKGLGLNLVAEGVETDAQLEYLRGLGCAEIQGWLFGKAESAETTEAMLDHLRSGGTIRPAA